MTPGRDDRAYNCALVLIVVVAPLVSLPACRGGAGHSGGARGPGAAPGPAPLPTLHEARAASGEEAVRLYREIRLGTESPDVARRAAAGELMSLSVLARRDQDDARWREVEQLAQWALARPAVGGGDAAARWHDAIIEARAERGDTDIALRYAEDLWGRGMQDDGLLAAMMRTHRRAGDLRSSLEAFDQRLHQVLASGRVPWSATREFAQAHQEAGTESEALSTLERLATEHRGTDVGDVFQFEADRLVGDPVQLTTWLEHPNRELQGATLMALSELGAAASPALPDLKSLRNKSLQDDPAFAAWVQSVITGIEADMDTGSVDANDRERVAG